MERLFFILGTISAGIAVAAGAFGAHGLKVRLDPQLLNTFEVGVRYQMYHALALLAVAWALTKWPSTVALASGWLFVIGTVLFSGSLYVLTVTGIRWWGAVTPFGGIAFIAGWLCLAWATWKVPLTG